MKVQRNSPYYNRMSHKSTFSIGRHQLASSSILVEKFRI